MARGVAGAARTGSLFGEADIRAGRAMVGLKLAMLDGDKLAARLDAEPDRDRFDLDVRAIAPRDGLIPAHRRPSAGRSTSLSPETAAGAAGAARRGCWSRRREAANLVLAVDSGRYRLKGTLAPAPFLKGKLQRLTAPQIRVEGDATFIDRILDGQLALASPSLRAVAKRRVSILPDGRYDKVSARRRPAASAGAVPQHDRPECAAAVDARRAPRERQLSPIG